MPSSVPDSAAATAASSTAGGDIPSPDTVEQMKPDPKWIPLESNPQVSATWAGGLGLSTAVHGFSDVYGLDPELLAMVPSPSKAVLLVFPITDTTEQKRHEEDAKLKGEQQPHVDPTLMYIKQTISNACGTIGLLHALGNSNVTLRPESPLSQFFMQCQKLTPEERGKRLEETTLFAKAHIDAATTGQSHVPTPDRLDTDLHFTCFVIAPSPETKEQRLIELDGRRAGPIDLGPCDEDRLLGEVAKIVKEKYMSTSSSINFGMISLGPASDV
ncbi:peptidase C12, ubiquitin carboxyl-terminal hydrolase 1 [Ceratobasidium sp. AG-Ba]|nr:peptidase C12, ubiquitin carboxyl-terminal hydrolase 1 [Ceratobasidium sp. AG-Ba]